MDAILAFIPSNRLQGKLNTSLDLRVALRAHIAKGPRKTGPDQTQAGHEACTQVQRFQGKGLAFWTSSSELRLRAFSAAFAIAAQPRQLTLNGMHL